MSDPLTEFDRQPEQLRMARGEPAREVEVKLPLSLVRRIRDEFDDIVGFSMAEAMKAKARGGDAKALEAAANGLLTINRLLTAHIQEATRTHEADPSLPPLPAPMPGQKWQHWKGTVYVISSTTRDATTKELLVSYHDLTEEGLKQPPWTRSLREWHDAEPKMGGRRRFELVEGA